MNKRIWLALIAFILVLTAPEPTLAQQSHPQGRRNLIPQLPQKPAYAASGNLQNQQLPESGTNLAADSAEFVTFDAPGAGTGTYEGTFPNAINPDETITGYYSDETRVSHGFLRDRHGSLTSFDPVGSVYTDSVAINPAGAVTGQYCDANSVCHGYIRDRDGAITAFDAPGAGSQTGQFQGTYPGGINPEGAITGSYLDTNNVAHGFVRARNGAITTFDPAGSTFTFSAGINPEGAITGSYADASGVNHGFLRDREGTITSFDVLGAASRFTSPTAINQDAVITGSYFQPISGNPFGGNIRGFLRTADGDYATFDAATYSPCCIWTFASAINAEGAVTGYDNDGYNLNHGFLRLPDGTITLFDAPGAGKGNFQGTLPTGINAEGAITGYYLDANNVYHGFLRKHD